MPVIDEYEATDEIEEIYYDIRQSFRVTGVNLIFRSLAVYDEFFIKMWQEIQPVVITSQFCEAADRLRLEATLSAAKLKKDINKEYDLGESQAFQIKDALDLYHYINPKLLLMVSYLQFALAEENRNSLSQSSHSKIILRRIPTDMYPMEMISENPNDPVVKKVFKDIKNTLGLKSLNSDYRTLGLWPGYLSKAWMQIKPVVQSKDYKTAAKELRDRSRELAVSLPISRSGKQIDFSKASNLSKVKKMISYFEDILPGLILNIVLFQLDWKSSEQLKTSRFTEAWQNERGYEL